MEDGLESGLSWNADQHCTSEGSTIQISFKRSSDSKVFEGLHVSYFICCIKISSKSEICRAFCETWWSVC